MNLHKPLFASVVEREPSLWGDFTRDEGIVSVASFPLRCGPDQQAFGALFFNYRKAHEFLTAERKLFETFANAAATAIYGAQTADLAERRSKRLQTALDVATKAGASIKQDDVLRGVLTVLRDEFQRHPKDGTAPYIMLYDERDGVLELPDVAKEFYQPNKDEYQHRVRLPLNGRGITTRTAREARAAGETVVVNVPSVHEDPDYEEVNSETQTEMCAGLVSEGRLLGALVIKSARPAAFDQDDEKLFEMAARQVAIALDRVRVAKQRFVHTKKLTSLAWRSEIAHEMNRSLGGLSSIKDWFDAY